MATIIRFMANMVTYLIINKKHPINAAYNPGENPTAKAAFNALTNQMRALDLVSLIHIADLGVIRPSMDFTGIMFANMATAADRFSARPGYSEHQSGLAFDVFGTGGGLLAQPNASTG